VSVMQVLQNEPDRTVLLEPSGSVVRKVFHSNDAETSRALAEFEYDRLRRFHDALASSAALTCPRPLELCSDDTVYIRMERATGVPMQEHLLRTAWSTEVQDEFAAALCEGLSAFVATFGEPYWDFILRNMFYDDGARLVTFLDFGFPPLYEPMLDELRRHHPIEVSLAALLCSAVFDAGRPSRMARRREHLRAYRVANATIEHTIASAPKGSVQPEPVREMAAGLYRLASGGGSRLRSTWYRSVGAVLARPAQRFAAIGGSSAPAD
jgi:hypothetical protein